MSALIPAITLAANLATVIILLLGGHFVIAGSMSLGDFTAFNTYLAILIFPIILIGFMSNVMAQAGASYMRISVDLDGAAAAESRRAGSAFARRRCHVRRFTRVRRQGSAARCLLFREGRHHDRDHRSHGRRQDADCCMC